MPGGAVGAGIADHRSSSGLHTQKDLKAQFYKSTGLAPLNSEDSSSQNKVMLNTRLKEIFQHTNDQALDKVLKDNNSLNNTAPNNFD